MISNVVVVMPQNLKLVVLEKYHNLWEACLVRRWRPWRSFLLDFRCLQLSFLFAFNSNGPNYAIILAKYRPHCFCFWFLFLVGYTYLFSCSLMLLSSFCSHVFFLSHILVSFICLWLLFKLRFKQIRPSCWLLVGNSCNCCLCKANFSWVILWKLINTWIFCGHGWNNL